MCLLIMWCSRSSAIDRMYCNVYVPQLQHAGGLLGYIQRQLGLLIASTALLAKITISSTSTAATN